MDALINYVDDFAASVGAVRDEARARAVVAVLEDFGFIVNWPKTDLSMATSLEVLGFIIDTERMTYDVPPRRAEKLTASARAVLDTIRGSGRGRWAGRQRRGNRRGSRRARSALASRAVVVRPVPSREPAFAVNIALVRAGCSSRALIGAVAAI